MSAIVRALAAMEVDEDRWVPLGEDTNSLECEPDDADGFAWFDGTWEYDAEGPGVADGSTANIVLAMLAVQRARFAHAIATANRAASMGLTTRDTSTGGAGKGGGA